MDLPVELMLVDGEEFLHAGQVAVGIGLGWS